MELRKNQVQWTANCIIRLGSITNFKSHTSIMRLMSVCPSICGKNPLRDENRTGTMGCGSDGVVVGVGLGCEGRKGRHKNMLFDGQAGIRITFIISRTFTRGRYGLLLVYYIKTKLNDLTLKTQNFYKSNTTITDSQS